jgi:hypothetical protein
MKNAIDSDQLAQRNGQTNLMRVAAEFQQQ